MAAFDGWANFYVIVGSSAGALIGLQFVVLTLLAEMPIVGAMAVAGSAYTTPTVVHFGAVLLLSALLSAPWDGIAAVATLWGLMGVGGVVYVMLVARRLLRPTGYQPVFEDRLFHVLLPTAAYAALVLSALAAFADPHPALFLVGAAVLLLLTVGIHNAWDTVTYHIFVRRQQQREAQRQPPDQPRNP